MLAKLLINVVSSIVLLMYTRTLGSPARIASADGELGALRSPSPVLHAAIGVLLLLTATGLSVYKPRGMTRYGWRKHEEREALRARRNPVRGP